MPILFLLFCLCCKKKKNYSLDTGKRRRGKEMRGQERGEQSATWKYCLITISPTSVLKKTQASNRDVFSYLSALPLNYKAGKSASIMSRNPREYWPGKILTPKEHLPEDDYNSCRKSFNHKFQLPFTPTASVTHLKGLIPWIVTTWPTSATQRPYGNICLSSHWIGKGRDNQLNDCDWNPIIYDLSITLLESSLHPWHILAATIYNYSHLRHL